VLLGGWLEVDGRRAYENSVQDVLSKQDTLELNDEEVDELFHVIKSALEGFLGNRVVAAGAEGASQPLGHDGLPSDFGSGCDAKDDVHAFHDPAEDGEVAACEDGEYDCGEGDGCCARMFPLGDVSLSWSMEGGVRALTLNKL
jgi:hypothetical protein